MVMNELIEPGLKPDWNQFPLVGIFLSSIVLIVFNITYQEGGVRVFLPVWRQIAMVWGHELKKAFEMVVIL